MPEREVSVEYMAKTDNVIMKTANIKCIAGSFRSEEDSLYANRSSGLTGSSIMDGERRGEDLDLMVFGIIVLVGADMGSGSGSGSRLSFCCPCDEGGRSGLGEDPAIASSSSSSSSIVSWGKARPDGRRGGAVIFFPRGFLRWLCVRCKLSS